LLLVLVFLPFLSNSTPQVSGFLISNITVEGPSPSNLLGYPAISGTCCQHSGVSMIWQSSDGRIRTATLNLTSGIIENRQAIDDLPSTASFPSPRILGSGVTAWIDCCTSLGSNALAVSFPMKGSVHYSPNIFPPANNPQAFDIAEDFSGNLYLVWRDGQPAQPGTIRFCTYRLGNGTFSSPLDLGPGILSPTIAVGGDPLGSFVFVAWGDAAGTIQVRRSLYAGRSFEPPTAAIDVARSANRTGPRLAVGQHSDVGLVWQSQEADGVHLRFAFSTDNAQSFGTAVDLEDTPGLNPDLNPSISWSSVAWSSYKDYQTSGRMIRVKTSPTIGWSPWSEFPTGANNTSPSDQKSPSFIGGSGTYTGIYIPPGTYFLAYELLVKNTQPWTHEVHLVTNFPFPKPSPGPRPSIFGSDLLQVLLIGGGLAVGSATLFLLLRRRTRPRSITAAGTLPIR
jgi:hypothetical protein